MYKHSSRYGFFTDLINPMKYNLLELIIFAILWNIIISHTLWILKINDFPYYKK